MGELPTVTLQHRVHGKLVVNETDYAFNLGTYIAEGWKRVGERDPGPAVEVKTETPAPVPTPAPKPEPEPEPVHRAPKQKTKGGR